MLAGLVHPQLRHALIAMHERPQHHHGLESLAQAARMSRTRFAQLFRELVGQTPLNYLGGWRMALAQDLLQQDLSLAQIAGDIGYGSAIAFNRASRHAWASHPAPGVGKRRRIRQRRIRRQCFEVTRRRSQRHNYARGHQMGQVIHAQRDHFGSEEHPAVVFAVDTQQAALRRITRLRP